jgi:hypothetical protein
MNTLFIHRFIISTIAKKIDNKGWKYFYKTPWTTLGTVWTHFQSARLGH